MARKLVNIGMIGVDSGQVVIMDPCYIDSNWQNEAFTDIRKYKHKTTGAVLQYRVHFENFESPIPEYDGQTMNQLIKTGEWDSEEQEDAYCNLSYNTCCKQTLSKKGYGSIHYNLGHEGLAVCATTGYGDGTYPVFAEINKEGRIMKLVIDFK